ncbi:MAG: hypothetical protein Q8Q01_01745 [archaeon]|nr:hypothetical protein [archaeon]
MGKTLGWIIGIVAFVFLVMLILPSEITGFAVFSGSGEHDLFASELAESGVKMYGAYWCSHCAEQKKIFGSSWGEFKDKGYIECSLPNAAGQTDECNVAGIKSYPTWEFADGSRISGVMPLEQLSVVTGISLE